MIVHTSKAANMLTCTRVVSMRQYSHRYPHSACSASHPPPPPPSPSPQAGILLPRCMSLLPSPILPTEQGSHCSHWHTPWVRLCNVHKSACHVPHLHPLAADRYPAAKMQEFASKLHAAGQHWAPIFNPGISVQKGYRAYEEGSAHDIWIKDVNGDPYKGQVRATG